MNSDNPVKIYQPIQFNLELTSRVMWARLEGGRCCAVYLQSVNT